MTNKNNFTLPERDRLWLEEIRDHLAYLHDEWENEPDFDGHCKSNEGYVGVLFRFPNWHECDGKEDYANKKPIVSMIEVYSYLFGPFRLHQFDSIQEAHKEVMSW